MPESEYHAAPEYSRSHAVTPDTKAVLLTACRPTADRRRRGGAHNVSVPTMLTFAGSLSWAEGRMAPTTLHPRCAAAGVPRLMHILNVVRLTRLRHMARMPGGSVVQQLSFAEGLVGPGGVVSRLHLTWRDRAFAALRPVL
eukprot:363428-Chlamydomonas_euryale.AAC.7